MFAATVPVRPTPRGDEDAPQQVDGRTERDIQSRMILQDEKGRERKDGRERGREGEVGQGEEGGVKPHKIRKNLRCILLRSRLEKALPCGPHYRTSCPGRVARRDHPQPGGCRGRKAGAGEVERAQHRLGAGSKTILCDLKEADTQHCLGGTHKPNLTRSGCVCVYVSPPTNAPPTVTLTLRGCMPYGQGGAHAGHRCACGERRTASEHGPTSSPPPPHVGF